MKLIFFGTDTLATTILNALLTAPEIEIAAIVTQLDKPAGRGKKMEAPLTKRFGEHHDIPVLQYKKLDDAAHAELKTFNADVFVVAEYGLLIPEAVLSIPLHGTLNVHPSLLPQYRGATPIQSALLHGEKETGVTIMLLDKELDHGPIIAQEKMGIEPEDTAPTLEAKLGRAGAELLIATLPKWVAGKITAREQDHTAATFCKKLSREDGRIDWTKSAEEIYRMWRAYLPWPGIFTEWNGKRVKMTAVSLRESLTGSLMGRVNAGPDRASVGPVSSANDEAIPSGQPAATPFLTPGGKLAITCGKSALIVERLQIEGKKELDAQAFLAGYPAFVGAKLE